MNITQTFISLARNNVDKQIGQQNAHEADDNTDNS